MRLTDHEKLPSVKIQPADQPFRFMNMADHPRFASLKVFLDSSIQGTQTAAFLVIRNDSILYEVYRDGFHEFSVLPSNSMSKSFTGTLVGIAVDEGKISSTADPMTKYIPELLKRDPRFANITIQHLLDMRSGFLFNEGRYDLKDDAVKMGFRPDLRKHMLRIKIAEPPGRFRYQSINTQYLGWIVERATGMKLAEYLQEKLWKKIGTEKGATWNTDKRKNVLASAGLNGIARDFAKLGRLYLNGGAWNDVQIINNKWVSTIANRDTMEAYGGYKYQWWNRSINRNFPDSTSALHFASGLLYPYSLRNNNNQVRVSYRTPGYSAVGFLNQYLYLHPDKKLIIVRIGRRWGSPTTSTQFIFQLGDRL